MNFLKNLFGGGGGPQTPVRFFYVRPKRCQEILQVRVDLQNELSQTDDGGYYVRKVAQAIRCPFEAELHIYFDKKRALSRVEVENGEAVSAEVYETWLAEKAR